MLKGQKKHIDKEQGKTKHGTPRGVNYRATHNKKNSHSVLTICMQTGTCDTRSGDLVFISAAFDEFSELRRTNFIMILLT